MYVDVVLVVDVSVSVKVVVVFVVVVVPVVLVVVMRVHLDFSASLHDPSSEQTTAPAPDLPAPPLLSWLDSPLLSS